jgi:hypothetical protein
LRGLLGYTSTCWSWCIITALVNIRLEGSFDSVSMERPDFDPRLLRWRMTREGHL